MFSPFLSPVGPRVLSEHAERLHQSKQADDAHVSVRDGEEHPEAVVEAVLPSPGELREVLDRPVGVYLPEPFNELIEVCLCSCGAHGNQVTLPGYIQ